MNLSFPYVVIINNKISVTLRYKKELTHIYYLITTEDQSNKI